MGTYSTSDTTKMAFIIAAGELFAEHGFDAVSLRDIAKKAGENIGNVHYHFGGKKGLINAVIDYVVEPCQKDPLGCYIREHEELFATRAKQAMLVCGIIGLFFKSTFAGDRPKWCRIIVMQLLHEKLSPEKDIFDIITSSYITPFFLLYQKITGNEDAEKALAWTLSITATANLLYTEFEIIKKINSFGNSFDSIKNKLMIMTMRSALTNLNLVDEADNAINQYLENDQLP